MSGLPAEDDGSIADVCAIVLAAGGSTRMGRPKALLDLDGETALARILGALREAGIGSTIVVLRPELLEDVRALVPPSASTDLTVNPDPARGRTSSLQTGLRRVPATAAAVLLCPVDVPLFEPDDVRALVAAWRRPRPAAGIAVPIVAGRRGHPALFDRAVATEFLELGPDEPAHRVVRRDPTRRIEVQRENVELTADLDTLADYRAALERMRQRRG